VLVKEEIEQIKTAERGAVTLVKRAEEDAGAIIRDAEIKREELLKERIKITQEEQARYDADETASAILKAEEMKEETGKEASELRSLDNGELSDAVLHIVSAVVGEENVLSEKDGTSLSRVP
jgi:vacuolar-type H+-ATPase subunit H